MLKIFDVSFQKNGIHLNCHSHSVFCHGVDIPSIESVLGVQEGEEGASVEGSPVWLPVLLWIRTVSPALVFCKGLQHFE